MSIPQLKAIREECIERKDLSRMSRGFDLLLSLFIRERIMKSQSRNRRTSTATSVT